MSNINDERILKLRKQIEEKKEEIGKAEKFVPVTNCSLTLEGERLNINVLNKEQLIMVMVKLHALEISAKDLSVEDEFMINGFKVSDWIVDLRAKIDVLKRKEEEKKLKGMESKLSELLSDGKRVELEIDEIESFLNE